ncbi:MAG: hypothetical protein IPI49_02350 [Myxococcales bacterium]|nr:hypothetical protein [Myxococcales bacterium]
MTRALRRASAVPGVLVASLVAGCVFTSLGRTHELAGEVRGLWAGAGEITVRVTSERETFLTSQSRNGEIAFTRGLPAGVAYTVTLEEVPEDHRCQVVAGASGVAQAEASEPIIITCVGPDARVAFDSSWGWTFDATLDEQTFAGSVLTQEVRLLTASDEEGMTVQRDGQDVALGELTVALPMGTTTVTLAFTRLDGLGRSYQLVFERGAREIELVKTLPASAQVRSLALEHGVLVFAARANGDNDAPLVTAHERDGAGWSAGSTRALTARDVNLGEQVFPLVIHKGIVSLVQGRYIDQFTRTGPGIFTGRTDLISRSNAISSMVAADEDLYIWNRLGDAQVNCGVGDSPHTIRKLALRTTNYVDCVRPPLHQTSSQAAVLAINATNVFAIESGLDELHVTDRNLNQQTTLRPPNPVTSFRDALVAGPGLLAVRAAVAGGTVVQLFEAAGTGWSAGARLTPPVLEAGQTGSATFGSALALRGDVLVAGEAAAQGAAPGAVHVFRGGGASWAVAKSLAQAPANPSFGSMVVLAGDTLAVGSNTAVYVYR